MKYLIIAVLALISFPALAADLQSKAMQRVRENLKDPDSARFDNLMVGKDGFVCGTVNAKNSLGGYTGGQLFVSNGGEFTYILTPGRPDVVAELLLETKCGLGGAQ